jgi:predicted glycosyltransferase
MTGPSVFFYVQHLLGIGHLARASRIARAMVDGGLRVTLVTGGMPVPGFPAADIPHVALPPIAVADGAFKGLVDRTGTAVDQAFLDARRDKLIAAFRDIRPDIVMVEAFPFGRKQVRFELLPLIDAIEATNPRPKLVSSVRDILQLRGRPDRDAETAALVRAHFDRVLVHGDPTFARLEETFPFADRIADKVSYTGLVCGPKPVRSPEQYEVLVSAGGGAVGAEMLRSALAAAALLPDIPNWLVITGPNLRQDAFDAFAASAPPSVRLERFRTDFGSLLASARLSVSQAGYNTVGDILQAGCRSLLVPYSTLGETEQADRAARLEQLGRAHVIGEGQLDPALLAAAIRKARDMDLPDGFPKVATDGAMRTVEILRGL